MQLQMLLKEYPDYTYAKLGYAEDLVSQKKYDEALDILNKQFETKEIHYSELSMLLRLMFDIAFIRNDLKTAGFAHSMLEEMCDNFPADFDEDIANTHFENLENLSMKLTAMRFENVMKKKGWFSNESAG